MTATMGRLRRAAPAMAAPHGPVPLLSAVERSLFSASSMWISVR